MRKSIIVTMLVVICMTACQKPYERVFKQHLYEAATEAQSFLDEAQEGTEEGQYKIGSKAVVQTEIDEGIALYWDPSATQTAVDESCIRINEKLDAFKKSVIPVLSNLRELLQKAESVLKDAESQESVSQDDVDKLEAYVSEVTHGMTSSELTQEEVNAWEAELAILIGNVEAQFVGSVSITVNNHSFEPQGTTDEVVTDFSLVSGWNNQGYVNGVNPWDGLHTNSVISKHHWIVNGRAIDGDYALYVQTYSMSVWQSLGETVRENSTYTVSFNATRDEWKDAEKTVLRVQLLSFNTNEGDFSDVTVLAEKEINNINQTEFEEYSMVYDTSANPDHIGKPITIALRCYYETPVDDSGSLAWKDVGAAVDKLSIIREKK